MTVPPRQPPMAAPITPSKATVAPTPTTVGAKTPAKGAPAKPTEAPQAETSSSTTGGDTTRVQLEKHWDEGAIINSIMRGDFFEKNLCNKYNNLTYHWRFFCVADGDYLYEGGVPKDIKEFYTRLDQKKQVIIAETGVTGYNITEVEMTTVMSNETSRSSMFTGITMKVQEPNGVNFLDAMRDAAAEAGIINYLDFFYYLELTFKGYDAKTGEIVLTPFADLPNGGRWLWTVMVNDIAVNLGSGGGQYTLTMTPAADKVLEAEWANIPDTIIARGSTVREMLDDIQTNLNRAWNRRLVIPENDVKGGFITHEFQVHGVKGSGLPFDPKIKFQKEGLTESAKDAAGASPEDIKSILNAGVDTGTANYEKAQIRSQGFTRDQILDMTLRPQNEDWNNIRTHNSFAIVNPNSKPKDSKGNVRAAGEAAPDNEPAKPTASIPRGTNIPETVISGVFAIAEMAQHLARDSHLDKNNVDDSEEINSKGFRECVTWQVLPEVRFDKGGDRKYDYYTNRYGRTIVWHIYPRIDQEPILSQQQIKNAIDSKGNGVQQSTLAALAARGFLPKRYDYLFTGLNTEVLNFDLNFNFAWQVMLPRIESYYSDQNQHHTRVNPLLLLDQIDANFDSQIGDLQTRARDLQTQTHETGNLDPAEAAKIQAELNLAKEVLARKQEAFKLAQAGRADAERLAKLNLSKGPKPAEQDYQPTFIEDILKKNGSRGIQETANSRIPLIPISFSGGDEAKQQVGFGGTGQYHQGRALLGSVLNQTYGVTTGKFQQVEVGLRGDPFWLGYGSYEKSIQNFHDLTVDPSALAYPNIGSQCFIFRFKYPVGVDDSGTVILKDNETVTGVYKTNVVKSKFSGGQFTQVLEAIRMPLIDLFTSIYGLKTTEDGEQSKPQPQPTAQDKRIIDATTADFSTAGDPKPPKGTTDPTNPAVTDLGTTTGFGAIQ